MVGRGCWDVELLEDRRDVLLDAAQSEEKLVGDGPVGRSFGEPRQHQPLAFRQPGEPVVGRWPGEELAHDFLVQCGSASATRRAAAMSPLCRRCGPSQVPDLAAAADGDRRPTAARHRVPIATGRRRRRQSVGNGAMSRSHRHELAGPATARIVTRHRSHCVAIGRSSNRDMDARRPRGGLRLRRSARAAAARWGRRRDRSLRWPRRPRRSELSVSTYATWRCLRSR